MTEAPMLTAPAAAAWRRSLVAPIRWATAATVLGALFGLVLVFVGDDTDAAMWTIVRFGALGGAIGALRITTVRFGAAGDPRIGGDSFPEIWEGYARAFADFLLAAALWLAGGMLVSAVFFFVEGARDATAFTGPLLLGGVWAVAFGVAWLAVALVWIPVSIVREAWRRRRATRPMNPWWYYAAVYLILMLAGIAAVASAFVLVPETILAPGRGLSSLLAALYGVDTGTLEPGAAITVWAARVLLSAMAVAMVVTAGLVIRRLTQLQDRASAS
ncbi:hypothetical protein [Microbacterium sp. zg-YB36]|uniref:hypothetical protein n=1 Tax=Microbacterium sp. zg-YB36 TaxID=2969407 RepID=UPI00214CC1A7|nr:hypothetical protein [Microbacterium sp. zg-YB36]MDL5353196.1 hypothetical protein [Microbacterium sp. zg-YB36]